MCVGPEKTGAALVWHVMAKQAPATLCGQRFAERHDASHAERTGHCPLCMAAFAKLMTTAPR
ncbi:hypothetical protein P3H78_23205 [Streptomyces sp. K1PA1]|uniref:Uncharacterized protein n=2 Tax=Streptomyces tropicalis TaxID=3034234 RepID=A0ABT6AAL2_9ACTN|nr:hypothetical protein [Streptomyces tropicalis]